MRAAVPRALAALVVASALVALWRGGGDHLRPPGRDRARATSAPRATAPDPRVVTLSKTPLVRDAATSSTPRRPGASGDEPLVGGETPDADPSAGGDPDDRTRTLCVVAPYRARAVPSGVDERARFVAYLLRWLRVVARIDDARVWIVEQVPPDEFRFNRGWLLNLGVVAGRLVDGCTYFALHDVDLLPVDPSLPYGRFPAERPTHLSPPGRHPEYAYSRFNGGAWTFTWEQLLDIDGYSHAYWGWGQEDDDLGARMRDAGASRDVPNETAATCPGRVRECAFDPRTRECGREPYSEHAKLFRDVPARVHLGVALPKTRTLVEGTCFWHAHEGGFSRDALESAFSGGAADGSLGGADAFFFGRPDAAFARGREWRDVLAGTFRRDRSTGIGALAPAACGGSDEGGADAGVRPPRPGHGFELAALETVDVALGEDGVAREVRATPHACEAARRGRRRRETEGRNRWSGNIFFRDACEVFSSRVGRRGGGLGAGAGESEQAPSGGEFRYARLRARLTCDEDAAPWCVGERGSGE